MNQHLLMAPTTAAVMALIERDLLCWDPHSLVFLAVVFLPLMNCFALSLNCSFMYTVHKSPALQGSMGTSPGDVSCKINNSGITSIIPDSWPLSPGSLYKQTRPSSFLLSTQNPVRLSRERKWLNRECRAYSHSLFSKKRNVFLRRGALKGQPFMFTTLTFLM